MRSRFAREPAASAGIRWLALALLTLTAWGCQPCPECPEPCPDPAAHTAPPIAGPSTDPTVTLVTIAADLAVSPLSPTLSKSANAAIQWYNAGSIPIAISLIGAPLSIELAPGEYSNPQRLTENTSVGQTYDYTVRKTTVTGGPPDPPDFSVGP